MTNIVVTCWNALDYTEATLQSLFNATKNEYFLTIINNGSEPATKDFLANLVVPTNCKELHVITNEKNMGPGYATNQGFAVSKKLGVAFTCLCNNDLYFQTDWLTKLELVAQGSEKLALIGPLRPATSVAYDNATSTIEKVKALEGYGNWREELEMYIGRSEGAFDEFAQEIIEINGGGVSLLRSLPDTLSSCCLLVRNNIFEEEFGYIADPRFTHYGSEDSDMTWAVIARGYVCAVVKDVYVHHFRGKSLTENKLDRVNLIMDSNRIFFEKWRPVLHEFLEEELAAGIDVTYHLKQDRGDRYWFLQRLNRDLQFWVDGKIDESKFL